MHARQVLTALVGAAALLTPYLAASEEERGARMEEHFRKADTNNDGSLTREEAKTNPRVAKNFDAIDTDKSGTVTLVEIQAAMKKMAKEAHKRGVERFKAADKNGDGMLDREEAKAMPSVAKNFAAIDADKSGTVTLAEIQAAMKKMAKEAHKRGLERFKAADKDNDGSLTREEAKAMPRVAKNFATIDADKSGTVTGKEIHVYMRAHQQEQRKN